MRFRSLFIPVSLALIFSPTVMAGNPDSPAPPDSTFSLNLEDLYLRLMTGANGTSMTFTEPATAPGTGTMHTIDEIMAASPAADDIGASAPMARGATRRETSIRAPPTQTVTPSRIVTTSALQILPRYSRAHVDAVLRTLVTRMATGSWTAKILVRCPVKISGSVICA